jgi:aminopeptidase N
MFRALLLLLLPFSLLAQPDLKSVRFLLKPNFSEQSIDCEVDQLWQSQQGDSVITLLLYPNWNIEQLLVNNTAAHFNRKGDSLVVSIGKNASQHRLHFHYSGKPQAAQNPPWDGGFIWRKDANNKDWLTLACQDNGAQLWWPTPAKYNDEPDTARITCTYPAHLFFKSNGRLVYDHKDKKNHLRTSTWEVISPINPYNITLNIGDYVHLKEELTRTDGTQLKLNYYPLRYNKDKALAQFKQVKPMLRCFEKYFGNYPFTQDEYSVVETPYAGMEHQSAIAYGNGYVDGYNGSDYSGIGLPFDFILIHETGHEWWGNSVSASNKRDFWLQEAFCTYAEYVYVYERFGKAKAEAYIDGKKRLVSNKAPILSDGETGIDMYSKGALMLHTLQQFASSDEEWFRILKEFALEFRWKSITTEEVENWFSQKLPNVEPVFFEQYLSLASPPQLEVIQRNGIISFRISNALQHFRLPLYWIAENGKRIRLDATANLQTISIQGASLKPDSSASYFQLKTN